MPQADRWRYPIFTGAQEYFLSRMRWKGDHVSLLSSWLYGGDYRGDGRIMAVLADGLNVDEFRVWLEECDGIQYSYVGFQGNEAPVPAPSAAWLPILGVVALGGFRRSQRREDSGHLT